MITHTNKKVVCIKDIPSNLIEEAIFILKSDALDDKNKKISDTRKEIILKETEDLVEEYSNEFSTIKICANKKNNILSDIRLKITLIACLIVCGCYLISLII